MGNMCKKGDKKQESHEVEAERQKTAELQRGATGARSGPAGSGHLSKTQSAAGAPALQSSLSVRQTDEGAKAEADYKQRFGSRSGQLSQQQLESPAPGGGDTAAAAPAAAAAAPGAADQPAASPALTPRGAEASPALEQDPTAFCKSKPDGIYLVMTGSDHGTIFAKYSREYVEDALAFGRPSQFATIADFKYKKPLPVQSRVQSGKSMYFLGWCQWFKEARMNNSEVVLLPLIEEKTAENPVAFPPMRIFFHFGTKVVEMHKGPKGKPVNLKFAEAIAVVPESYVGFDQFLKSNAEIDRTEFLAKAKVPADKAYLEFAK